MEKPAVIDSSINICIDKLEEELRLRRAQPSYKRQQCHSLLSVVGERGSVEGQKTLQSCMKRRKQPEDQRKGHHTRKGSVNISPRYANNKLSSGHEHTW